MPNLAISAQTNNGKTRLMKHFLSLHQASGTIAAPVFYVQSPSVVSLNYVIITSAVASASLARWIFSRIFWPEARQTYFFGFWLRSAR